MMIFQHTIDKVLSGEKTQTRRIVKAGDLVTFPLSMIVIGKNHGKIIDTIPTIYRSSDKREIYKVVNENRTIYEVGKTYAAQPARGKPAVARIRITGIRREDVRYISYEDVKAEGFKSTNEFLLTWLHMHDKPAYNLYPTTGQISVHTKEILARPAERYDAWALTFELVQA